MATHDFFESTEQRERLLKETYRRAKRLRLRLVVGGGIALGALSFAVFALAGSTSGRNENLSVATGSRSMSPSTASTTTTIGLGEGGRNDSLIEGLSTPSSVASVSQSTATSTTTAQTPITPTTAAHPQTTSPPANSQPVPTTSSSSRLVVEPGQWALIDSAPDQRSLRIRVLETGCVQFHHTETEENNTSVRVTAYVEREVVSSPNSGCGGVLLFEEVVVPLESPLGSRRLVGACEPGSAPGDQRACALLSN